MIPFIGIPISLYLIFSNDRAAAAVLAILILTQTLICLGYLFKSAFSLGVTAMLEAEVQLVDAFPPLVFLALSATGFLQLIIYTLTGT